jgi:hypothetical protein
MAVVKGCEPLEGVNPHTLSRSVGECTARLGTFREPLSGTPRRGPWPGVEAFGRSRADDGERERTRPQVGKSRPRLRPHTRNRIAKVDHAAYRARMITTSGQEPNRLVKIMARYEGWERRRVSRFAHWSVRRRWITFVLLPIMVLLRRSGRGSAGVGFPGNDRGESGCSELGCGGR